MIGVFIPLGAHQRTTVGYIVCESGCWEWCGETQHGGYGRWKRRMAHRVMYERMVGVIPRGLTLDHLCRNPKCVRPDHLEPVTIQENCRRGFGPAAQNRRKIVCKRGHTLGQENARGKRPCPACERFYSDNRTVRGGRTTYRNTMKQDSAWVLRERDRQRESKRRSRAAKRGLPSAATAALLATGEGE